MSPDPDADDFYDDVTDEVSGSGYTAGGMAITGADISYDSGTKTVTLTCDNISWSAASLTGVRVAVVYNHTPGSDATRGLICYQLSDSDLGSFGGTFDITIPGTGLATITRA